MHPTATGPPSAPTTKQTELAKLQENTVRHINSAAANELAGYCPEPSLDLSRVTGTTDTPPLGFTWSAPGPRVGGQRLPTGPQLGPNEAPEGVKVVPGAPGVGEYADNEAVLTGHAIIE